MNVTMIGSCFCGFLKPPLTRLYEGGGCHGSGPLNFQTLTTWQRIDSIVDIINGNPPDHELVGYYIENGHWERDRPLGIKVEHEITTSEWFARAILAENKNGLDVVSDTPDLLIFDSLSDWRHPLYRHRRHGWKCFLGRILFEDGAVEKRFNEDFEFVQLLDINEINRCIKTVIGHFRSKNSRLKAVYIHFPAMAGYLEDKWVTRAREIEAEVARLKGEFGQGEFMQLVIPPEEVRPLTDPTHPNYSRDVWNHFYDEVYEYCAGTILDWYCGPGR